ncbi:MAG: MBL fold metallo-hydrolase [Gemmatimonadales bacterium]
MRLTVLGTGTSFGVPQIGCDCEVCRSTDPRDRRTRTAALVETAGQRILIDTRPRSQAAAPRGRRRRLDAGPLYTHEHADHVAGIDDLRIFSLKQRRAVPVYGLEATLDFLRASYRYIFDPAMVPVRNLEARQAHPIEPGVSLPGGGRPRSFARFEHGHADVVGFRIRPLAYLTRREGGAGRGAASASRRQRPGAQRALVAEPPTHLSIGEAIETATSIGSGPYAAI